MNGGEHPSRGSYQVVPVTVDDVLPLRLAVLRKGMPLTPAGYDEDNDPTTHHLGVRIDGIVVACSTWVRRPFPASPQEPAMQLKGMAVAEHLQGTGVGRDVLRSGIEHARHAGCTVVWARARNSAMGFYERNGFSVVGDEFVDATTALPHHIVMIRI